MKKRKSPIINILSFFYSLVFSHSNKGFLFTIGAILFASTIVFFAQIYSGVSSSSEYYILTNAKSVNLLLLNDDLGFDLMRILGINSIDVNNYSQREFLVSGVFSSSPNILTSISGYSSFLNNVFFLRSPGSKSINLSGLLDGKAEVYFGDSVEMDYNYGDNIVFFPVSGSTLSQLDFNIRVLGSLDSYSWSSTSGSVPIRINYLDDTNSILVSDNIDPSGVSTLTINYSGGSTLVSIGSNNINGSDKNSSIKLVPLSNQIINYSIKPTYSIGTIIVPVKLNSVLSNHRDLVDSNSYLVIKR